MSTNRSAVRAGMLALVVLLGLTTQARAVLLGNPLVPGGAPTDGALNVIELYLNAPAPSDGLLTSANIFKQSGGGQNFEIFVFRPTGTPNEFTVVSSTGAIDNLGVNNQVHSYGFGTGVLKVEAGDVFAHIRNGIPFSDTPASPDPHPLFFPAGVPVVGSTVTMPPSLGPVFGGTPRTYSLAMNFVATDTPMAEGGVGNALIARSNATDSAANVLNVYSNSPFTASGAVSAANIFRQEGSGGNTFEVFILRPSDTAPGQYFVADSSGLITPPATGVLNVIESYEFPNGPMDVEPGDLFAHFGRGISFTIGDVGNEPLYFPSTGTPVALTNITLGGGQFPFFNNAFGQERQYGLQLSFATVVPEPATGLLGLLCAAALARRRRAA